MKTMYKNFFFGLIMLAAAPAFAQESQSLTLKSAIAIAIANNLEVKQDALLAQAASINYNQAKANRMPSLFGNLNQGIAQGRNIDPGTNSYVNDKIVFGNYGLSTNVTLFSGWQLKNIVKRNLLNYEAGKLELEQSKEELTLTVILAYLQVLNNQDLVSQANNQLRLTKKQVDRLEILNREGTIIPAQLYELRGQFANDELAMITNSNAVESAKLTLSQLLNIPYKTGIQVERVSDQETEMIYSGDANSIYLAAQSNLSVIKAAELRKKSADANIKVAKSGRYPTVVFGADLFTNYSSAANKDIFLNEVQIPSGDFVTINGTQTPVITTKSNFNSQKISYTDQFINNYGTSVSLGVRVPILNGSQARNNIALAKTSFKSAEYLEENARMQLKQSIEQAFLNMNAAFLRLNTLKKQVADFEASYRIAEVRFNAGASNQVEYLIAKNNVERAQINLISARYDYILRTKVLDYYQGKGM